MGCIPCRYKHKKKHDDYNVGSLCKVSRLKLAEYLIWAAYYKSENRGYYRGAVPPGGVLVGGVGVGGAPVGVGVGVGPVGVGVGGGGKEMPMSMSKGVYQGYEMNGVCAAKLYANGVMVSIAFL